jgi:hypothetical protein
MSDATEEDPTVVTTEDLKFSDRLRMELDELERSHTAVRQKKPMDPDDLVAHLEEVLANHKGSLREFLAEAIEVEEASDRIFEAVISTLEVIAEDAEIIQGSEYEALLAQKREEKAINKYNNERWKEIVAEQAEREPVIDWKACEDGKCNSPHCQKCGEPVE